MFVGRDWTLVTRDLRTLIYLLNLELREECSRTLGPGAGHGLAVCNRGAAAEADAIGRAAAEAGAIGEQQLHGGGGKRGAAVPQSGEQQLKRAQSGSSSWRRRQTGSSSAAIRPGSSSRSARKRRAACS